MSQKTEPTSPEQNEETGATGALMQRLGPAGPMALVATLMPGVGGFALLWYISPVGVWIQDQQGLGYVIYIVCFAIFSGLALLPTWVQAALGGWAYGFGGGYPAALAGFIGGSVVAYATAGRVSGDRVVKVIDENPKWRAIREALVGGGFWKTLGLVTLVRIPFNSPFALMNLLMATTGVRKLPYFLGTVIGMAPRTAVYVWVAAGIQELSKEGVKDAKPGWWIWAGLAGTLVVVFVISHIANKAVARVAGIPQPGDESEPEATG